MVVRQEIKLENMSCGHCVMAVKEVLSSIDGIDVESVEIGRAVVSGKNLPAALEIIKNSLDEEGYPVLDTKEIG